MEQRLEGGRGVSREAVWRESVPDLGISFCKC